MAGGFENAPVSKTIFIISIIVTFLFGGNTSKSPSDFGITAFDLRKILQGEIWRFFICSLGFRNLSQLVIGLMLMYTLRHFERQFGSRKFGSFLFLSVGISLLVQLAIMVTASTGEMRIVPSPGPFYFIYAILPLYYEKSWTYLLAIQLLLSDGLSSVVAGGSGLLAGYLYLIEGLGFQEYRIPVILENSVRYIYQKIYGFFALQIPTMNNHHHPPPPGAPIAAGGAGGTPYNPPRFPTGPNTGIGGGSGSNRYTAPPPPPSLPPPPSDELIATLTNLGFEHTAAVRALVSCGNNVEMAANMLLSGG